MKNKIKNLPQELQDLIEEASITARQCGVSAYLVGGFVRDLVIGVGNFDLDIVVEGDGIDFAEKFADRLKAKFICHRRFGTATITLGHHLALAKGSQTMASLPMALAKGSQTMASLPIKIDIASARKEIYLEPAALPTVEFGCLKDDLKRRDFTINALALDIKKENFGRLIDLFDGYNDILNGKIRFLHDLSFIDDPTRILRAIRFEKRFNFKIEDKTFKCLKEAVNLKMLEKVQPQRLRDELILLLKEAHPIKQIKRLEELTGLRFLSRELKLTNKTYDFLESCQKELRWFDKHYQNRRKIDSWLVYFIALIDSLNIKETNYLLKLFVFRKGEELRALSFKNIDKDFIRQLSNKKIRPSEIYEMLDPLSYEVIILIKAKYNNSNIQEYIEDFFAVYNDMRILISGHDLRRLGVAAGPFYQKIFKKVLAAKLNGTISTYEEELKFIEELINKNN